MAIIWRFVHILPLLLACALSMLDARADADDRILVVMGASYAAAWPIKSLGGHEVLNRGVAGNTTTAMLDRFEQDALGPEPGTILLWGHINDIFRSDPAAMEQTLATIEDNVAEMHRRAASRGIEVVLATEVTITQPKGFLNMLAGLVGRFLGKTSYQTYINGHVMEMNARLRQFAESNGLQLLDFESQLADETGIRRNEYAVDDGSHLSAAAYDVLTAYATSQLAARP